MMGFASSAQASRSPAAAGIAEAVLVWPAWAIAALGGLCVLVGLTYFMLRLRRGRTRRDLV